MLQIPSDTVTQITQVYRGAISIHFGTNMANIFPWLMQVVIIKWWIIKLLKTLYFCTNSPENSHCNVHCFTPVFSCVQKNRWIILIDHVCDQHPCKHVTSTGFNEITNFQCSWFSTFINLDVVKFYNNSAKLIYSVHVNILCSMCLSSLLEKMSFCPRIFCLLIWKQAFSLFLSQSDWERLWCVDHCWSSFNRRHHSCISCFYSWGLFYWHGLTLIPAWISNYIHYKLWDEITYPFLNFNGATVEV